MSEDTNSLKYNSEKYFDWMLYTHYSEQTVSVRRRLLKYFFNWCDDLGLVNIQDITRPIMESYQRFLFKYRREDGKPLVISSQSRRLSCIKAFFKYLSKNHLILYNPVTELQFPREPARLPRQVLNENEVQRIMIQPDLSTPEGVRDRTMLELFYSTGMRRMEVANLDLYDVDFDREIVMIKEGKGRKDRVIPVGAVALQWIRKYIDNEREMILVHRDETALFLSYKGVRISMPYITQLSGNYVKQADIGKQGSCHIFRHTMATLMLENGADVRYIQQMLGHASLKTTEVYTKVSIKQLKAVHNLTHPSSQLPDAMKPSSQKSEPPAY